MYENVLTSAGLSPDQAQIYEILLKNGRKKAAEIAKLSGKKRGITYKVLDGLIARGLVVKKDTLGEISIFEAAHPANLTDLVEQEGRKISSAQAALDGVLGQMTSDFNLIVGKPGVRFYEGLDGMKKVLDDSLTSEEVIYSYVDAEAVMKYIKDINQKYAAKRERLGIIKKSIIPDNATTRNLSRGYLPSVTENRFIKSPEGFVDTVTQIYDGKISYIILKPERMVGVIIENDSIYKMQRGLFEVIWQGVAEKQSGGTENSDQEPDREEDQISDK